MKKALGYLVKAIFIIIVVSWVFLVIVERIRYNDNKPMLVVLKEKTIDYDDGKVYVYWGLGYKVIIYKRTSLNGKEFGPFFETVKDRLPNRG